MSDALSYLVKARPDAMAHYFAFLKNCGKHLDPKTRDLISVITKVHAQTERGFRQYLGRALRDWPAPEPHRAGSAEDFVAREYSAKTGQAVQRYNAMLRHLSAPVLGHIDRLVVPPGYKVASHKGAILTDRGLECKTASAFASTSGDWGEEGTDQVPAAYLVQCATYMALTGCQRWDLAVLIGNQELRVYHLRRDAELEAEIIARATEWWNKYVVADVPPEPVCEADVRLLYPRDDGRAVEAERSGALRVEGIFTHLAEASEHQAEQITLATEAIKKMARAMDKMAEDAQQSADVARRSLEIAGKGAEAVRRTIGGMDTIRQQIQETSKRIKRLGESSQEIGDIVEIIDDIADQTNILALNAAMQAAMAGDAGRGFAVVADEVQRLAERSSNATKQIDALVKTIQADTNEAVSSMETTTAEVVAGAKLAEDAGVALREIEEVSKRIAEVTDIIARSATQQSEEATKIDDTVSVIQEITAQTLEGTNQTASAIGRLADLAEDLQKSVAGFRLPG